MHRCTACSCLAVVLWHLHSQSSLPVRKCCCDDDLFSTYTDSFSLSENCWTGKWCLFYPRLSIFCFRISLCWCIPHFCQEYQLRNGSSWLDSWYRVWEILPLRWIKSLHVHYLTYLIYRIMTVASLTFYTSNKFTHRHKATLDRFSSLNKMSPQERDKLSKNYHYPVTKGGWISK